MSSPGDAARHPSLITPGSSPSFPLRLIIDPPQAGPWNMAVDEALLDAAAERGVATLRFYQWAEPTLSLGYFQRYADRALHEPSRACPCVRRRSGGGAILHDRELTYSLALPIDKTPAGGAAALYRLAHDSLVIALREVLPPVDSIDLRLAAGGIQAGSGDEPFLCFQRRSDGDLLLVTAGDDHKIGGSAQRKRRGGVLQHGSVLLAKSPWAPELPGIREFFAGVLEPGRLAQSWAPRFAAGLGAELAEGAVSKADRDRAAVIADERFDSADWTRRR